MSRLDALLRRMERARELAGESPSRALALLPPAGRLPPPLRPERDFLEAEARRAMGYFRKAEALYARVLGRVDARQDPALAAEAALGSAAGLRSLGRVREARLRLAAAKRAGLRHYGDRISLEEALIERAAGRYAESLRRFRRMLGRDLPRRDPGAAAFLLWAMGGAERFRGELAASERAFKRSLALARRAGDRAGEGYALFGLGGVTRVMGRLAESERAYRRAARVFRGSDDVFARAYAWCGWANALRQQGRLSEALAAYRRSHALYSRLEDDVDLAYVDWGIGEVHMRRGNLQEAGPWLRRALAGFRKGGETRGEVLAALSTARLLHAEGRTAAAERLFARAAEQARRAGLHAHLEIFT